MEYTETAAASLKTCNCNLSQAISGHFISLKPTSLQYIVIFKVGSLNEVFSSLNQYNGEEFKI